MGSMVFAPYEDQMHLQKQTLAVKVQKLNCHHENAVQGHHQLQHYFPLFQLNHLKNYSISLSTPVVDLVIARAMLAPATKQSYLNSIAFRLSASKVYLKSICIRLPGSYFTVCTGHMKAFLSA